MNIPSSFAVLGGRHEIPARDVWNCVYAQPDDVVVAGGTLIEGIGTIYSDFDCYVFCKRRPLRREIQDNVHNWVGDDSLHQVREGDKEVHEVSDNLAYDGMHVHVQYVTYEELDQLIGRIERKYEEELSNTMPVHRGLSADDTDLVHKILIGTPMQNAPGYASLKRRIPAERYCYVLYRSLTADYYEFTDILGWWHSGEHDLAANMARGFLEKQMRGFLHLNLYTNAKPKWLMKYVRNLPPEHADLGSRFLELMLAGCRTHDQQSAYVVTALDLADDIYARSRTLLDRNPAYPSCDRCLKILESELVGRPSNPELTQQVEFRRRLYTADTKRCRDFLAPAWAGA